MNERKKASEFGGQTDGLICSICHKITEEEEIRIVDSQPVCDNCDLPPNSEIEPLEKVHKNLVNYNSLNTFTNDRTKVKEKSIQFTEKEIEKLNNQVQIPKELNIVDCPPDINPDKE
jgi:hypothetical protein